MTLTANWSYPTAIRFGAGRVAELPAGLRRGRHPSGRSW